MSPTLKIIGLCFATWLVALVAVFNVPALYDSSAKWWLLGIVAVAGLISAFVPHQAPSPLPTAHLLPEDPRNPESRYYQAVGAFMSGAFCVGMIWLTVADWTRIKATVASPRFLVIAALVLGGAAIKGIYEGSRDSRSRRAEMAKPVDGDGPGGRHVGR